MSELIGQTSNERFCSKVNKYKNISYKHYLFCKIANY